MLQWHITILYTNDLKQHKQRNAKLQLPIVDERTHDSQTGKTKTLTISLTGPLN